MANLVNVYLHGSLGHSIGEEWSLCVSSVSEAIKAIEMNTKKLFKYLASKDKEGARYRVLINGDDFICEKKGNLGIQDIDYIRSSELVMKKDNLKTIDIVPILEGNDPHTAGIFTAILGVILIIVGIVLLAFGGAGAPFIVAGIALLGAGIAALLSKPPTFTKQQPPDGTTSYLFGGPTNTTQEGNPVPIGYGTLMVGSQVISASYVIDDYNVDDKKPVSRRLRKRGKPGGNLYHIDPRSNLNTFYGSHNDRNHASTLPYIYEAAQSGIVPTVGAYIGSSGTLLHDRNKNVIRRHN